MDATAIAALIGALLLVLVPGGALAHVLGFRGMWWLALAPVVSVAAIAATGVVAAPLRIRFQWWEPAVVVAVACAVILLVRRLRRTRLRRAQLRRAPLRRAPLLRPRTGRWTRGDAIVTVVVAGAAIAAAAIAVAGIGSFDHISQTYDGLFHLNAVAWIQSTGDASSFDLYRITHPGDGNQFYPAAWHAIVASTVQLTGASIPVATNAVYVVVQSVVWMPGIALLGAAVAPARRRHLAGALSALASVGLLGFPALLLAWGTLYPTALAYALLPVGLVLTMRIMRWIATVPLDGRLPFPGLIVAVLAIWLVASALAHPRSLFCWVVLAAPLVVIEGVRTIRRIWRRPAWRRRLVIVLVAIGVVLVAIPTAGAVYVYKAYLIGRPISDHLNGGPATASQGLLPSIVQALDLGPPSPTGGLPPLPAAWILAALVVIGVVIAAVRFRARWVVIAWILVIMLYAAAAGSNSDVAKVLTGLWYKDKFRLFSLLPILQAPLIALVGVRLSLLPRPRARLIATSAAVVAIGAGVATSNVVTAAPGMIGAVYALPAHDKGGLLLTGDEQRLLEELPRYVPAGQEVAGDPWDGSSLSWAIGDRQALFPHVAGVWSPDALLVASSLDRLRTDPAVCAAVQRLGIHWVVEDPQTLYGTDPATTGFIGFHRAARDGVLIPVAHVGSAGLYRIPSCGSAAG